MSNQLATIFGLRERLQGKKVYYQAGGMAVHSFYGGDNRGKSLQLNMSYKSDHIQLTRECVQQLADTLNQWLTTFEDKPVNWIDTLPANENYLPFNLITL